MCSALLIIGAGLKVAGGIVAGDAAKKHGQQVNFEEKLNAAQAEQAASDAVKRGEIRDVQEALRDAHIEAAAVVQQSASGFDVNVGAPLASRRASQAIVEVDRKVVQYNAAMDAYGLRQRARAHRQQGEYAEEAGNAAFVGSFLNGLVGAGSDLAKGAMDLRSPSSAPTSAPTSSPGSAPISYSSGTGPTDGGP